VGKLHSQIFADIHSYGTLHGIPRPCTPARLARRLQLFIPTQSTRICHLAQRRSGGIRWCTPTGNTHQLSAIGRTCIHARFASEDCAASATIRANLRSALLRSQHRETGISKSHRADSIASASLDCARCCYVGQRRRQPSLPKCSKIFTNSILFGPLSASNPVSRAPTNPCWSLDLPA